MEMRGIEKQQRKETEKEKHNNCLYLLTCINDSSHWTDSDGSEEKRPFDDGGT